jgi:hypothetical protein
LAEDGSTTVEVALLEASLVEEALGTVEGDFVEEV